MNECLELPQENEGRARDGAPRRRPMRPEGTPETAEKEGARRRA